MREYARERLETSGEAEATRQRHADRYLALAERGGPELEGPEQAIWLARLGQEHDNVRAAIGWALATGRQSLVARFGWALHIFWAMRGHHREGRRWMDAALDGALSPPDEARALAALGLLARMHGDYAESIARLGQALERFRALGDTTATLMTLNRLGHSARLAGDYARSKDLAEEGLGLARRTGDTARIVWMLDVLGLVALAEADYPRAVALFEEALPLAREIGDRRYSAAAAMNLAQAALATGQYATADEQNRAAFAESRELGLRRAIALSLDTQASIAAGRRQPRHAARLFGAAEMARELESLARWSPSDQAIYGPHLARVREQLDAATFAAEWESGRALTVDEAITHALDGDGATNTP